MNYNIEAVAVNLYGKFAMILVVATVVMVLVVVAWLKHQS